MKKVILIVSLLGATVVATCVSTIAVVSKLTADGNPIAQRLGFHPCAPTTIAVDRLPVKYADAIEFLIQCEPSEGTAGWPVVTGLVERTKNTNLDEISHANVRFVASRRQPLGTCLAKILVLKNIADRVLAGESIDYTNRVRLAALLEGTPSLAQSTKDAMELEFKIHSVEGVNISENLRASLNAIVDRAGHSTRKLRAGPA